MRSRTPCWDFVWLEHVCRSYACCRRLCEFIRTAAPCLDCKTLCPWSHPPPLAPIIILGPLLPRPWAQEEGRGLCSIFRAEHSEVTSCGSWCWLLSTARSSFSNGGWVIHQSMARAIYHIRSRIAMSIEQNNSGRFSPRWKSITEKLRICIRSFSCCCDKTLTEAP